jgi:hypothetical protein
MNVRTCACACGYVRGALSIYIGLSIYLSACVYLSVCVYLSPSIYLFQGGVPGVDVTGKGASGVGAV